MSERIGGPYRAANLTRFVQLGKIEIDANKGQILEVQICFFVCTIFDSFLKDFFRKENILR
ncbi:hypothetical protein GCWU000342_00698 [Shuttleworthella satelles DSM 14600]|uniref:Uncharacterized protein n=1 Tax=Shuttleworthella satelles DSM 14600 TaxID=626523 RepID=C4G9P4_9FIRM|nr:hypothetical protein GCWU000342_00698 [Shuttleworthia satelles DSM 14600]